MQVPALLHVPPPAALFADSAFSSYKTAKASPKKFKCPHLGCDRSFAKSDHLRTHVRTHTGERPFRCTHEGCHKEFSDLANLKRHMRVHTGERPFTCPETGCGKQFSVSSNLKQHMRVHTGERPYSCPICGKAFGHVSSRRKHMNIHEGSSFKNLLETKRSTTDQLRKISPHVARWRTNQLMRRDYQQQQQQQQQHVVNHMIRRPSSRGSESSYESTSPTSYPTLHGLSPNHLGTPDRVYRVSPGADPLAGSFFTFRPDHYRFLHEQRVQTAEARRLETQPHKPLRKEVSRPRPCYPGQENDNTVNLQQGRKRSSSEVPPREKTHSGEMMETEEMTKQRTQALEELRQESVIAAGRIAIARCAGFNNAMELGRYVTVAMDTSYKIASLAMFLYQNARMKPRQVPVRTIQ
ncbi:hypothetical protein ACHWQZ_G017436 [Mnemiopsis leidyi]